MEQRLWYAVAAVFLCLVQVVLLASEYYYLAPAFLPAIVIGYLIYRYPEVGILLFIFVIPFEGLLQGSKLFSGAKILGILLMGVVTLKVLLGQLSLKNLKTPLLLPLLALLFSCVVSGLLSHYSVYMGHYLRQLVTAMVVFFLVLMLSEHIKVLYLVRVIVSSTAITALITLVGNRGNVDGRAVGFFSDPNFFALLLLCAIALSLYLTFHESSRLRKLCWGGTSVVILCAFQQTMSRSGLLILLAVFFLLALHYRYVLKKLSLVRIVGVGFLLLVVAICSVFVLPKEYRQRILSLQSIGSGVHAYQDRSLSRRTSYILVGLDTFKKNPLFGSGPGSFPSLYAKSSYSTANALKNEGSELFRRAHNTYLELLAETGLCGFFSLVIMIFLGMKNYWNLRRRAMQGGVGKHGHLVTHVAVTFIAITLFFLFLSVLNNKYFWIYLALSFALQHHLESSEAESKKMDSGAEVQPVA